jgi:hypothetical protein
MVHHVCNQLLLMDCDGYVRMCSDLKMQNTKLYLNLRFIKGSQNCENRLVTSSYPSVRVSSIRLEQLCSDWKDFHEI